MVGGGVWPIDAQENILGSYFLPVDGLKEGLFSGIVFADGQISYLFLSPYLMFGICFAFT